jgi:hypothetical protein
MANGEWLKSICTSIPLGKVKLSRCSLPPGPKCSLFTHSPIVTGALSHSNIFVMEQAADGSSKNRQFSERVFGLNAEQVLLSSYFNLQTTRTPRFEEQLREIERRAWNGDAEAAVEFLKKLPGSPPTNLPAVATR